MFELPKNETPQARPDIVDRLVEAMFRKKSLYYCDDRVSVDGVAELKSYWCSPDTKDTRKFTSFTEDERKICFKRFQQKGYHIMKQSWYAPNGHHLWCYVLKETKDEPETREHTYLF